jgi:hypothetical protein
MFDLLRGPQWTLLAFGSGWQSTIETCMAQFKDALQAHLIVPDVDAGGHARAAYGESSLFVIRPDNYVGMATNDPGASAVIGYLKIACAPSHVSFNPVRTSST